MPARPDADVGEVRGRTLTPDDALVEYLDDHGMRRISRRLSRTGVVDVVATAVPGIKDILVLGKVKQLERGGRGEKLDPEEWSRPADLIVVDAPAAGHAVTFLQSAKGLLDAVRVGPIRNQAQEVADLLGDPARTGVMLVTLAEETPVNELIETAYALEDRVGIRLTPGGRERRLPPPRRPRRRPGRSRPEGGRRRRPPASSDRSARPPPSDASARSCRPQQLARLAEAAAAAPAALAVPVLGPIGATGARPARRGAHRRGPEAARAGPTVRVVEIEPARRHAPDLDHLRVRRCRQDHHRRRPRAPRGRRRPPRPAS